MLCFHGQLVEVMSPHYEFVGAEIGLPAGMDFCLLWPLFKFNKVVAQAK